ncbi:OsmC family protein [Thiomonas sp. FB-6]|uniref:OsmC family protein n=1 Tax=Thiomonas sp. FB-6 TaxID=1158291 RepID=UPI00035F11D0|nr:OsmC family protein [Thiomonas sp. FB-6]
MECTVRWTKPLDGEGMAFVATTGSGHMITMDGAPASREGEPGGHDLAPRPMETVLAGTGGCTAYDVVYILRKGRQDVRDCSVQLRAERADSDPKVFTAIHMHFVVSGRGLDPAKVERAIVLSHEKYCSASAMLARTAAITTSFEIVEG